MCLCQNMATYCGTSCHNTELDVILQSPVTLHIAWRHTIIIGDKLWSLVTHQWSWLHPVKFNDTLWRLVTQGGVWWYTRDWWHIVKFGKKKVWSLVTQHGALWHWSLVTNFGEILMTLRQLATQYGARWHTVQLEISDIVEQCHTS